MKTIFAIVISGLFLLPVLGYSQKSGHCSKKMMLYGQLITARIDSMLRKVNLPAYEGQLVDTLLKHLPAGVIKMEITGWRSARVAEILHVVYPGNLFVEIHVRNFQFMNPKLVNTSTPKQNWNIDLFKKESVTYTVIFKKGVCINGCENQFR